jgi:ABC-type amino acid transport substrate-binding protein
MKHHQELPFQRSSELKRLFNQYFEAWRRKQRLGLDELAQRCGVSTQYLAHIGRYGRVPGKPILILLALNFELPDPLALFHAANIQEVWPYEEGTLLRSKGALETGFLSVHLDMTGFTTAIRDIVRTELRPKTLQELLAGRPLKVGLNRGQSFFFEAPNSPAPAGFFPELVRLLALALHCEVEFHDARHSEFAERLHAGEIDIFGPVYYTPKRIAQALFTSPFSWVPLGALGRVKKAPALAPLPPPKRLGDLKKKDYRIAVHTDSMSHHFALVELGLSPEQLVLCELPEETLERIILSGIPRPAHLMLTDAPHAYLDHQNNKSDTELLFGVPDPEYPPYEDTIAVRSDWPSVVALLNDTLAFLHRDGSIERLYARTVEANLRTRIMTAAPA